MADVRQASKRLGRVGPKTADTSDRAGLSSRHVAWMSIAAGVGVANMSYVQPLLRPLATSSWEVPYAVRRGDTGRALTDKRHRCTGSSVVASEETG
ncbi:hypothetical protein ACWCPX_40335 [Streptomyces olivaceoviridis]